MSRSHLNRSISLTLRRLGESLNLDRNNLYKECDKKSTAKIGGRAFGRVLEWEFFYGSDWKAVRTFLESVLG